LDQSSARVNDLFRTLSPDERARARRFYFARDQRRFTVGRGILRDILSRYLGLEPHRLIFVYGPKGKPRLAQELDSIAPLASMLRFNLSHSGELALYAFAYGREIGIDIEQFRQLEDAKRIASRYFSAGEIQEFSALPPHLQLEGFFNCWTRKESYLKATGDGLSTPLDCFEVSLIPGEPARFLHIEGEPPETTPWVLRELRPASGYAAALCVQGRGWKLHCWSWQERANARPVE
jgi:4'-phosphopantetheinyl transferase